MGQYAEHMASQLAKLAVDSETEPPNIYILMSFFRFTSSSDPTPTFGLIRHYLLCFSHNKEVPQELGNPQPSQVLSTDAGRQEIS